MLQSAGESAGLCRGTAPLAAAPPGRGAGAGRAVGPGPPVPPAPLPASARRGGGARLFRFPRPPALTPRLRRRLGLPRRSPLLLPGRGPTSWSRSRSRARAPGSPSWEAGRRHGQGQPLSASRRVWHCASGESKLGPSSRRASFCLFVWGLFPPRPFLLKRKGVLRASVFFFYYFFFKLDDHLCCGRN